MIKHTDVSYVLLHIDRRLFFLITHRKTCPMFDYTQKDVSYVWLHTKWCVLCLITHKKMCPMFDYTYTFPMHDYTHKEASYVWLYIERHLRWNKYNKNIRKYSSFTLFVSIEAWSKTRGSVGWACVTHLSFCFEET